MDDLTPDEPPDDQGSLPVRYGNLLRGREPVQEVRTCGRCSQEYVAVFVDDPASGPPPYCSPVCARRAANAAYKRRNRARRAAITAAVDERRRQVADAVVAAKKAGRCPWPHKERWAEEWRAQGRARRLSERPGPAPEVYECRDQDGRHFHIGRVRPRDRALAQALGTDGGGRASWADGDEPRG